MFCTNCGKIIDEDSNYCVFCGIKIEGLKSTTAESEFEKKTEIDLPVKNVPITEATELPSNINPATVKFIESKYDETYERDYMPTVVGALLLLLSLVIYISSLNRQYQTYEEYYQGQRTREVLAVINFIGRIAVTIWVQNIARFRNRSTWSWGLFAFFFPSVALILIGLQKKLKPKSKS